MTVKEILYKANLLVDSKLDPALFDSATDDLSALQLVSTSQVAQKLVRCINLVCDEILTDYFPVIKYQTVAVTDKKVCFSQLQGKPCAVLSVKDGAGKNLPFKYGEGCILLSNGNVTIKYTTLFEDVTVVDSVTFGSPQVTSRTVAYGVAMEYYLLCGDYENAQTWRQRFYQALKSCRKMGEIKMPCRRWL